MHNFKIRCSPELGRYAVASSNLKAGEVIVDELPFIVGPKQNSQTICLACYCYVDGTKNGPRCAKCTWPLCEKCTSVGDHGIECEIFANAKAKFQSLAESNMECLQLDCVTPLRLLMKSESDPEGWRKYIEPMEYHDVSRRARKEIWETDLTNIAKYIRGPCKLSRFSEELIMRAVGILEVNSFEARTLNGSLIRCVYPLTAILAHRCTPNVFKCIHPSDGFRMKLHAMTHIIEDQQLNTTYTFTFDGTLTRQSNLITGKHFICHCPRCLDPTELGMHFSSFKCLKCNTGYVFSSDPLDQTANWCCPNCGYSMSADNIMNAVSRMQRQIDELGRFDKTKECVLKTEELCKKFSNFLHPSHYFLVTLYQNLINMYGRVEGYKLTDLPIEILNHKVKLCRYILSLLEIFEPGISRYRAAILYELYAPVALSAKIQFNSGLITTEELNDKLQEAKSILEESIDILKYNDPLSQEGLLIALAKKALVDLESNCNTSS